jgi:hypothetical protein
MHGRRRSGLPRPAAAEVMVHRQDIENASYALINSTGFLLLIFYGFFLGETYQQSC